MQKEQLTRIKIGGYTRTAIGLHWAVALLISVAFPLGLYMHDLVLTPYKLRLFNYHKWIGIGVLLFAVLRVLWRFVYRPPDLPSTMTQWERSAASATHLLLYALLFIVPVTGWLASSANGFQTVWFGVLPLPDVVGKNQDLGRLLFEVHRNANYLLLALVGAHVAAALKHHFLARDNVLARMIPYLSKTHS